VEKPRDIEEDDIPEIDFSGGVRGKYLEQRAGHAKRRKFEAVLTRVRDMEPVEEDQSEKRPAEKKD
jgi:hypothetical protein